MKYWDIKPVCPGVHHHRHIRQLFAKWGRAGIAKDTVFRSGHPVYYITVTEGDPCTWYTLTDSGIDKLPQAVYTETRTQKRVQINNQ